MTRHAWHIAFLAWHVTFSEISEYSHQKFEILLNFILLLRSGISKKLENFVDIRLNSAKIRNFYRGASRRRCSVSRKFSFYKLMTCGGIVPYVQNLRIRYCGGIVRRIASHLFFFTLEKVKFKNRAEKFFCISSRQTKNTIGMVIKCMVCFNCERIAFLKPTHANFLHFQIKKFHQFTKNNLRFATWGFTILGQKTLG